MTNTINNNSTINNAMAGFKESININIIMKGWLAHNNKLFDRTCPQCGGMYSSYETANCPKCGDQLTFITTAKGKAMSVSEGTFYPCLSTKQKESDLKATQATGNGIEATYRFKMFSFADANGVLAPPQAHGFCHKGSLVEFRVINHQPIYSLFTTKEGTPKVEVLFLIYENYGDSVTLIKRAEVQNHTVGYQVDTNGNPVPLTNQQAAQGGNNALIQNLAQQLAAVQQQLNQITANANAQNQNPVTTTQNEVIEPTAGQVGVDPFLGAM